MSNLFSFLFFRTEWFEEERLRLGRRILLSNPSLPVLRLYARRGIPSALRPIVWTRLLSKHTILTPEHASVSLNGGISGWGCLSTAVASGSNTLRSHLAIAAASSGSGETILNDVERMQRWTFVRFVLVTTIPLSFFSFVLFCSDSLLFICIFVGICSSISLYLLQNFFGSFCYGPQILLFSPFFFYIAISSLDFKCEFRFCWVLVTPFSWINFNRKRRSSFAFWKIRIHCNVKE